jgi:hypothetical protein
MNRVPARAASQPTIGQRRTSYFDRKSVWRQPAEDDDVEPGDVVARPAARARPRRVPETLTSNAEDVGKTVACHQLLTA